MVAAFNRKQIVLGILSLLLSGVVTVVAFFFFRFASGMILSAFDFEGWDWLPDAIAAVAVGIIFVSGMTHHARGLSHSGYEESSLYPDLPIETGGAAVVDFYTHRVTGCAYLLSQFFLAGPLQLCRGIARFRSRIRDEPGLDQRLTETLESIESADRWQPLGDYRDRAQEVVYLIRMNRIQYSSRKGRVRSL